jgi:hypothetical protein
MGHSERNNMNKNQTNNALEVLSDAALCTVTGGASLPTDKGRHSWSRIGNRARKERRRS